MQDEVVFGGDCNLSVPFGGDCDLSVPFDGEMANVVSIGRAFFPFEEGTARQMINNSRMAVNFQNEHRGTPFFVLMVSDSNTPPSELTDVGLYFSYVDTSKILGKPMQYGKTGESYGAVQAGSGNWVEMFMPDGSVAVENNFGLARWYNITIPASSESSASTSCARYFVNEQMFIAYTGDGSTYWMAGEPYKWIAFWMPDDY